MENVKIKLLENYPVGAEFIPSFKHEGDAGFDLRNCSNMPIRVEANKIYTIPTGIKVAIPKGWCGIVMERSGLGCKFGVKLCARVIDSGYRGEIMVCLTSETDFKIEKNDRIAQLIFLPVANPKFDFVTELDDTKRGENGLGSTGVK